MITVIFQTRDDEMALARALAALVVAATDGLVRDVVVVDAGSTDGTLQVADAAGCAILSDRDGDGLQQAAAMARGEWLLFLSPATVLSSEWAREARAFIERVQASGDGWARNTIARVGRRRTAAFGWFGLGSRESGGLLAARETFRRQVAGKHPARRPRAARRTLAALASLLHLPPRLIGRV